MSALQKKIENIINNVLKKEMTLSTGIIISSLEEKKITVVSCYRKKPQGPRSHGGLENLYTWRMKSYR